ncbi:MAG: diguanylate cyclase [Gammaproteobacteria bacterium]|nr:diguanylate cyclase [Gammaproteobacteria bacterium]
MKTIDSSYHPRILIVNKGAIDNNAISDILNKEGYTTQTAIDFNDALKNIENHAPDIIMLDDNIIIDEGIEAIRKIKNISDHKNTLIIIITEYINSKISEKAINSGADELLNKPVNNTELLARIKSVLKLKIYREQFKIRKKIKSNFSNSESDYLGNTASLSKILLVDNVLKDVKIIMDAIKDDNFSFSVTSTGEEAINLALDHKYDLIILDALLPDISALDVHKKIKKIDAYKQIPIVIVSAIHDYGYKILCLEHEVDDFFTKPINQKEFKVKINLLLKKKIYIDKLREDYQSAINFATTDGLTGLYKRPYFLKCLDQEIKRIQRSNECLSIMMIDIDDFKIINDNIGHLGGDAILHDVGKVILNNIREIDLASRYGGEEFVILLLNTEKLYASIIAQRIQAALLELSLPKNLFDIARKLTVSIGISDYPYSSKSSIELLNKADLMLYQAKKTGKNKICLYGD